MQKSGRQADTRPLFMFASTTFTSATASMLSTSVLHDAPSQPKPWPIDAQVTDFRREACAHDILAHQSSPTALSDLSSMLQNVSWSPQLLPRIKTQNGTQHMSQTLLGTARHKSRYRLWIAVKEIQNPAHTSAFLDRGMSPKFNKESSYTRPKTPLPAASGAKSSTTSPVRFVHPNINIAHKDKDTIDITAFQQYSSIRVQCTDLRAASYNGRIPSLFHFKLSSNWDRVVFSIAKSYVVHAICRHMTRSRTKFPPMICKTDPKGV